METQRVQVNGITPNDKLNSHGNLVRPKLPSEEEQATSPLLAAAEDRHNEATSSVPVTGLTDETKTNNDALSVADLNKLNAMKTEESVESKRWENPSVNIVAYYKPEKSDESEAQNEDEDDDSPTTEGVKFIGLGDDDSICSSVTEQEEGPQIPDGGWGWVVVASAFLISTVADGLAFSFGLLHIEFHNYFGASQSTTSWIGSLFISVPLLAGPIMSALVDRYGCRMMTIVGGIASTIGFLLAAVSDSIEVMLLTFGVLSGLGMGLLYVTAVVSIAYWFEKKRNLAVSLGACGIGFGTVVYSPMTKYFIEEYGFRGAIVLLSGTLLNMCVCGAVMRDPEWWIIEQKKQVALTKSKRASSSISISARSARSGGGESMFPGFEELKSMMKSGETPEYILTTLVTSIAVAENLDATTKMNADLGQQKVNSVINLPTFLKQSEKLPVEVLEQLTSNKRLYNIMLENYPSLLALRSNSEQKLPIESPPEVPKKKPVTMSMKLKMTKKNKPPEMKMAIGPDNLLLPPIPENKKVTIVKQDKAQGQRQDWLKRQLSTNHHYLRDIRIHRNSMMHRGAMMNISKYKLRASSCPNIYRNSMLSLEEEEEERPWYHKFSDICKSTFDLSMFTEFHFFMMTWSTILLFIWFVVPYFYLIDYMEHNGSEDTKEAGTTMMAIIGVTSTIGIVLLGWAGDQPWINVTVAYAICLVICGVSLLMFPLVLHSYPLLAITAGVFGLSFSSSYSYTPSILVEMIALEKFTLGYGLILLAQGIGHLIGPPIAGLMCDLTGGWEMSFYMAGVWVILSGLLVGVIPFTTNFRICGSAPLAKDVEKLSQGRSHKDSTSMA